jgi:hypothetical protein
METIRKTPFAAVILNPIVAFAGKLIRQVRKALRMDFLPKEEPGSGGKKSPKDAARSAKEGEVTSAKGAETALPKSGPIEWQRIDSTETGADALFARTGGGREDERPPDSDRYVVIGMGSGDHPAGNGTGPCTPIKVCLIVETDCPEGKDKLVIDRIPTFNLEKLGKMVASYKKGEHPYYTIQSPGKETEYITYIPEVVAGGAIRVTHSRPGTIANLGVQFLVRVS